MLLLAAISFFGMQALAQTTITGTVTESNGEPIPGATVRAKDYPDVGTITDFEGKYSLSNVPAEATHLVYSFMGMKTQEVEISGKKTIAVTLQVEDKTIETVVITALGVSKEKKSLGYSVQDVSGEELTKAKETNIVNALAGQVSGVHVTGSSGAVGSSSRIVLRGATSITGNNEPLFVVDGVPIDNTSYGTSNSGGGFDSPSGSASINSEDIESVSVLKGANAAALYGSRAANGVILITTKKGKGSKGLGVSVNSNMTFETPLKLPDFQNSYGQGGDANFFEFIDGQHGPAGVDESWGMPLDIGLNATQFTTNGATPEPWVSHPDNIKNFWDLGITHTNNVAFTGGNEKGSFRLSFTNMGQKGIVPNTDYGKVTINGAAQAKLSDKLTASLSVNYIKSQSDNLPTGGYNNENPVQQMIWAGRNVDFEKLRDYASLPLSADGTAGQGTPLNWNTVFQNNPYWVLDNNLNGLDKDRVIGNVQLKYDFTDWISVRLKSGTDYWASTMTEQKAKGSNEFKQGYYRESLRNRYETNSEILVMINKELNEDFTVGLNLGGNRMKSVYNRVTGAAPQLELDGVYNLSNVKSGVTATLSNYMSDKRVNSVYFSGSVAFRHFLFLEFSGRNDWSSVLPVENNSFFYPAVSLSVDVTEAAGIKSDILSFLKVRGSYAIVGSSTALGPYSLEQTYGFRATPWGDVLLPFNGNTLNNPIIKPETTNSMEFGIEANFLKNRIQFNATYYNQKSKDLIVPVQVTSATGYQFAYNNVGEMLNSGFEIELGADVIKAKDFTWNISVNFAQTKNEVVSLGESLETLVIGGQWSMNLEARAGYPYGVIYGAAFERQDGEIVYENGLPKLDDENKVLGDIQPDWTGGFKSSVTYKGINLGFLVDAKIGGEIHSMTTTWGRYAGILSETLTGRESGVIGDGVMQNAAGEWVANDVVVSAEAYNKAAYTNSNVESAVFDASYVKLRYVSLGYTLPAKWLAQLPIRDFTISAIGRNLAILYSKVPHIDPESAFSSANGAQGQEFGQLPSTTSYGFNINFKF